MKISVSIVLLMVCFGSIISVWVASLNPLRELQLKQPDEYSRITSVAWFHLFAFSLYLAAGDYRKCIDDQELARSFDSAAWAARFQFLIIAATGVFIGAT